MASSLWKSKFTAFANSNEDIFDLVTSGRISEAEYLAWATQAYKMPILANNFFQKNLNQKIMTQNPSMEWSARCFPVHDWNGSLYIACLEPRTFGIAKKGICVLVAPSMMKLLWEKFEKPVAPKSNAIPGVISNANPAKKTTAHPTARPQATPTPVASQPLPDLDLNDPGVITLNLPKKPTSHKTEAPILPPLEVEHRPPPVAPTAPAAAKTPPVKPSVQEKTQTNAAIIPPAPTVKPVPSPLSAKPARPADPRRETTRTDFNVSPSLKEKTFIPEITNVIKMGLGLDSGTSAKTIVPFPEQTSQFTFIRTVYSEQVILEARAKIQDNTNPQDALMSAFRILKDYYKKLMWVVRDNKGLAYPIACNNEWDFSEEAWNQAVNFQLPNPFRLAKLTQKPYHGLVSPNIANDQFFSMWNSGKYPDVFTVVPVKLQGKVFAYFVGCGMGKHHSVHSLEIMQSVCNDLIETFARIHIDLRKSG